MLLTNNHYCDIIIIDMKVYGLNGGLVHTEKTLSFKKRGVEKTYFGTSFCVYSFGSVCSRAYSMLIKVASIASTKPSLL